MKKRSVMLLSAILVLCMLLSACGQAAAPAATDGENPAETTAVEESQTRSDMNIANSDFPQTLDPEKCSTAADFAISFNIYEPLVYTRYTGEEIDMLAESYTVSDDGLTYVFKIREGVTFHNGDTLSADDVKFSVDRAIESAYMAAYVTGIDSVEVTGENEVTITRSSPNALFIKNLKYIGIVDKAWVEATGEIDLVENGTAPYCMDSYSAQNNMVLTAYEGYWGEQPTITTVNIKYMSDPTAQLLAFEAGELDFVNVPSSDWERINSNEAYNGFTITCGNTAFLMLNTAKEPFSNPLVRQAISCAINKQDIIDMAMDGIGEVADTLADPSSCFGAVADCTTYTYDVEKAKELLTEAGYPDGFDGGDIMVFGNSYPKMAPVIQSALQAVGITVDIATAESSTYYADCFAGNFDMAMMSITASMSDMADYEKLYTQAYIGSTNMAQYKNDDVDALFAEASSTVDAETRAKCFAEINEIVESEAVYIPLMYRVYTLASVKGLNCVYDGNLARYCEFNWD